MKRNNIVLLIIMVIFIFSLVSLWQPLFGREDMRLGLDLEGGVHVIYQVDLSSVPGNEQSAIDGVIEVLGNRINPLGVTEPVIQQQGRDRIVVELPGATLTDKEKEDLARVALLEFGELAAEGETAKWENEYGRWKPATAVVNGETKELTSSYFKQDTSVGQAEFGRVVIQFTWTDEGRQISEQVTSRLVGKPLGIFEGDLSLLGEDGKPIAPIVEEVIREGGIIRGLSFTEAQRLSNQLNAGRLPVPLEKIFDQTVSPFLGEEFVDMSIKAGVIGIILVMLFMIAYYRLPGFLASLALLFYGVLVLAIFKLVPVTLSLAGLGGFIVSIGMAVDANVLIFERLKEELRMGRTLGAAIEAGFKRAWSAIWDSNFTTFIVCGILYWMGSSIPGGDKIMGFALTLFIGVAVSMFTAIVVTRTLLRLFIGGTLSEKISLFSAYVGRK